MSKDICKKIKEVKNAYRVAFRSLRTTGLREDGFLADDFLLRITRNLMSSFTFKVNGIQCRDLGCYSIPDETSKINIEVERRKFDPDNYIELIVFSNKEGLDKIIADGSTRAQPVLAFIHLCLGKRALDHKVTEDTQELNICYDQIEGEIERTTLSFSSRCNISSPIIRNENAFPIVDLFPEGFKQFIDAIDKYLKLDAAVKQRIDIALRWYYKGIKDKIIEDKFLSLWISFETISMEGETNVSLAKKYLAEMLNITITTVDSRLEIGRMFGCRGDLVHGKDLDQTKLERYCSKLQEIVEESLKHSIGIKPEGKLLKYL